MQNLLLLEVDRQNGIKTAAAERFHKMRFAYLSGPPHYQWFPVCAVFPYLKMTLLFSLHNATPLEKITLIA